MIRPNQFMDRRLPGWRDRRHRRPLAAVLVGGLVVMLLAIVFRDGAIADDPLWYVGLLVTLSAWLLLRVLTNGIAEKIMRRLDERERALRGRYAYVGFQLAIAFMMAMYVYLVVAQHVPSLQDWAAGLVFLLGCVAGALPTTLLAWNLPDDDPEDLAEPDEAPPTVAATNREDSSG